MSQSPRWLTANTDTAPTWPVWLLPEMLPEEASPLEGLARNRRYGYSADEPCPSPLRALARDRRTPRASG